MSEIKSTLELVLEKTRHLSLSEEEKRQQKRKEVRKQLSGLLQRYQEGRLDIQKIAEELDRLMQAGDGPDESTVRDVIVERIELGRENRMWFALLQTQYRVETAGLQSIEGDFDRTLEAAAVRRIEEAKQEIQRARRISGTAVVPNLDADRTWIAERQSIAADFHLRLAAELDAIMKTPA